MSGQVVIHRCGPSVTVQDMGRVGYMAFGVSRGGAADRMAMHEGAVLLGQSSDLAAFELAGYGGEFEVTQDTRIALTGAPMVAAIEGQNVVWNATHLLAAGQRLQIGAPFTGVYGYLHFGGGVASTRRMNSRSIHVNAGIGAPVAEGDRIAIGADEQTAPRAAKLPRGDRFSGGVLRVIPSAQTEMFTKQERARFEATQFTRSARGNRQGVQLDFEGAPFAARNQLNILSGIIVPGDIQMTGAGTPYILLPECQTTGGYPRIGTVIPQDQPKAAQAAAGVRVRFQFVTLEAALECLMSEDAIRASLQGRLSPLIRDPSEIRDLLAYQLIGGMTAGKDE